MSLVYNMNYASKIDVRDLMMKKHVANIVNEINISSLPIAKIT